MNRRGNPRLRRKGKNNNNFDFERIKSKKIILPISIFILILIFFSVIFSVVNLNNKKIIKGVKIADIDVSDLTQREAANKVTKWVEENSFKDIKIKYDNFEEDIKVEQYSPKIDIDKAVKDAFKEGKTGNIVVDNYQILGALLFSKKIELTVDLNNEKFNNKIADINYNITGISEDSNYYIEDDKLIIKKGKSNLAVDEEKFKKEFCSSMTSSNKEMTIPTKYVEPKEINIDEIYNKIYKEKKDAYISENPKEIHPEINGVDFAISIKEAKKLLKEDKEEYTIPLKITKAEVTMADLGKEAYPYLLGNFSTTYSTNNKNRETNLKLASEKINNTIIYPNEQFSYNKIVGERTISAGYKEAMVYSDGKVVEGIGGGICQLSSTLYNAVIYANLEVTQRHNHRFLTSYVEEGRDATVSWGTLDFCFKNTRNYPIKVVSDVKNGVVNVSIYGTKEEKEYEIVIENKIVELIPYETKYVEDDKMEEGKQEIKQYGANGARSKAYKIVKSNGNVISKEELSTDIYRPLERIIVKGTKKEDSVPMFAEEREDQPKAKNDIKEEKDVINPELLELIKEL